MDAATLLHTEVRELVRRRGIDPLSEPGSLAGLVREASADYLARADAGLVPPLLDPEAATADIIDALAGMGPLQRYLDDDEVEEIWVNGADRVFVARSGRPELTTTLLAEGDLRVLVERMLRVSGRRLDMSSPFVDAQLPGGERLHVVIPPITGAHWAVNIRKHMARAGRLTDLVRLGSLPARAAAFLDASVQAGLNILVSGATQAGKTTMVRALAGAIPAGQRIITCEEVFELSLRNRDCVAMQTRPANLEGAGEITLRRLVKEALRMRPDRLLIGEVREAEALDLLIAMNSGLPAMSTLHANSAREAVVKICTLPLLAGENVSAAFVMPTVASAIDLVVHLGLDAAGRRTVREIHAVTGRVENGVIELADLFHRDRADRLVRGTGLPPGRERYERAGHDLSRLLAVDQAPSLPDAASPGTAALARRRSSPGPAVTASHVAPAGREGH
ncbi:CpaF family protein [Actinomyces gaoshouyii]|uniref:Pilus assembly protein CpaF n=1 Tax=Actinomyces gaoshouyii TaxID=1960083 RepID=A0A8H9LFR4_9ACTO|nr:ATPase, T2SS/T4P/T4SS family [Actinomyces gaoshouyii]GGO96871.1 pilus assembly protein CpaF [Actinomyces gaoshouyii]